MLPGLDGCFVGSVLLNGKGSAGVGPVSSCKIVIAASADPSSETRSVSLSTTEILSWIQTIKDEGIKNYNKCIITNDEPSQIY
jgi:hypothetical protein